MFRTNALPMINFDPFTGLRTAARAALVWHERFRQRLALAELEPRMQRDVGLTPGAAAIEAQKPFWLG